MDEEDAEEEEEEEEEGEEEEEEGVADPPAFIRERLNDVLLVDEAEPG